MARIAFFSYSTSLAHAGRAVTLARALKQAGHDVLLAGQPRYLESSLLVDRAELAFCAVHEPPLGEVIGARGDGGLDEGFAFAGAVADEVTIYETWRPDVVVTDNRRSAVVSAELAGIPCVALTNASLLGPLSALDPTVAELAELLGAALERSPSEMRAAPPLKGHGPDHVIPIGAMAMPAPIRDMIGRLQARPRAHVHELNLPERTLVLDVEELYPVRDLPATAEVVGPILFDLATQLPPWWASLRDDAPIVYVTFGSTGDAARFELAVEELATLDAQVVVTGADLLAATPPNVHATRYLPASVITRRAALVVCHGGSLTMYHALAAGVPVLAVPNHVEQALEVLPLLRRGAARVVPKLALGPGQTALSTAAREMLADGRWREAAQALAPSVQPARALERSVAAIEALAAGAGAAGAAAAAGQIPRRSS